MSQPGIMPEPCEHARFVILHAVEPAKNARPIATFLAGVPALAAKVAAPHHPQAATFSFTSPRNVSI